MNQSKTEKFILIGPYPPPLGGVSVFIYRYSKVLKSQGCDVQLLDWEKLNWLQKIGWLLNIIFNPQKTTFHVNGFLFYILFCLLLRPFQKKIIFIDHSFRGIDQLSGVKRKILNKFLTIVDEYVLVGEHLRQYYSDSGYQLPANTIVRNAFLPPPLEDEEKIWKSYDPSTLEFIKNHSPIIIANAYQITIYNDVDLYGIDMCINETALLKQNYPNIGFLFALAEIGELEVYEKYLSQIDLLGIRDNFHFMTGQKELWPLFKKADLMIRPTSSDGYPLSVAEALSLGCPAIASDVCERAKGTILFRNRDLDDLNKVILNTLKSNIFINHKNLPTQDSIK
jgi:glycosyltransferase involved in cell wall biosynthesis